LNDVGLTGLRSIASGSRGAAEIVHVADDFAEAAHPFALRRGRRRCRTRFQEPFARTQRRGARGQSLTTQEFQYAALSLFLVHAAEVDYPIRRKFDIWKVAKFEGNYALVLRIGGQSVNDERHYPCLLLIIRE
jgi:hypothetical protein